MYINTEVKIEQSNGRVGTIKKKHSEKAFYQIVELNDI